MSGTTAQPPHLENADAYRQARAALTIVEDALQKAGSSIAAVVRTVTYVTDIADAPLVVRAHREVFGDPVRQWCRDRCRGPVRSALPVRRQPRRTTCRLRHGPAGSAPPRRRKSASGDGTPARWCPSTRGRSSARGRPRLRSAPRWDSGRWCRPPGSQRSRNGSAGP
ncbi:Rid family hydrolase [Actinoplanes utahensis]|uniref:Rid family hydrolase n=1 Tax=Actinoplanes utahensis TaxID=1869 RepID=UPI003611C7C2